MKRVLTNTIACFLGAALMAAVAAPVTVAAQNSGPACAGVPGYGLLKAALNAAVAAEVSGLNMHMWGTVVDRDGIVWAVAFSGSDRGAQWPGSRVIAAQKANTANAFSLDGSSASGGSGFVAGLALSTANLYSAVQPGGSLFGLQESNPVNTLAAYKGPSANFGMPNDPLLGEKVGGVNVFGGGLGLYAQGQKLVGAVGVSGDTSCADHNIAWRVRHNLNMDHLQGIFAVSGDPARPDNIVFDIIPNGAGGTGVSVGGFGHPTCINTSGSNILPAVVPLRRAGAVAETAPVLVQRGKTRRSGRPAKATAGERVVRIRAPAA